MRGQLRHLVVATSMTAVVLAAAPAVGEGPAPSGQAQQGDRASEACHRGAVGSAGRGPQHVCDGEPSSAGVAKGDFDGDNIGDLAIGVPLEDIGSVKDAGAVQVIYGTPTGLSGAGNELWHQDVANTFGVAETFDEYGAALASGDFDNDGYSDLAVGVPGESIGSATGSGAVHVLYGGPGGLTTTGQQLLVQGLDGLRGTAETGDRFGQTLAWGRFDGGPEGDLAIGAPNEDVGSVVNAGAVNVVYGVQDVGLRATGGPGNQLFTQAEVGLVPEPYDGFGATMTAGDFDGNTQTDLAISAHSESLQGAQEFLDHAGRVTVVFANISGLGIGRTHLTASDFFVPGAVEYRQNDHDHFGYSLATRSLVGGRETLFVGIPWADYSVEWCADFVTCTDDYLDGGLVEEFATNGTPGATAMNGSYLFRDLSRLEREDADVSGSLYGYALAAGGFQGAIFERLAVGAPGAFANAGAVFVRTTACFDEPSYERGILAFDPNATGFGSVLSAWDFNGDKITDLAVGVPRADVRVAGVDHRDAGVVHVLSGRAPACNQFPRDDGGITTSGKRVIHQGATLDGVRLEGAVEAYDEFGRALY